MTAPGYSADEGYRMDFVFLNQFLDEDERMVYFQVAPDPARYEWRTHKDERYLYDKLDDVWISESAVESLVEQARGRSLNWESQELGDAARYVHSRLPEIRRYLRDERSEPMSDKTAEVLETLRPKKRNFVVLSIDVVRSSAAMLEEPRFTRILEVLLYELSSIVPYFHGYVLKYTGDGLIAFFPEPSLMRKNDLAIDCALTMRRLIYEALNPSIIEIGAEPLDIRIGIDSGEAEVLTIGSEGSRRSDDILGEVMSLSAKIQEEGQPGDILLGKGAMRLLHTNWRRRCSDSGIQFFWRGRSYNLFRMSGS